MGTKTQKVGLFLVALCLGLAALGSASPPAAELAPPTVAVHNAAGAAGEGLVSVVTEAVTARAQTMPQFRASVGQPWALDVQIANAVVTESKAEVKVVAELTPPSGGLRYIAEAESEGASGAEAASKASNEAMDDLSVIMKAAGTVYHYDDRKLEAWISIGADQGLRPRARIAFMHNGQKTGEGTVISVKDGDAIVRVRRNVPAGNVTRGDDAHVIRNGPRSAVTAQIAHEHRQSAAAAFLAAALLGGLILSAR